MRTPLFFLLLCWVGLLGAQETDFGEKPKLTITIPEGPTPWTSLDLNNAPENFQFAIVTDRTGGHRPGIFEKGVKKVNLLQPEFVMSVGDLIEGYTEDLDELNRQWDEFDSFVEKLEMPFFYVPGNHDITNPVMEELWKKRLGPTNYYFVYKNVLFLALNSEDQARGAGRGTISDEQYEWIEQTLADHEEVRWTLVFMHQPLWDQSAETLRWNDVEQLLAERKHTVFVGHRHSYVQYERNDSKYYILGTTGGGSRLRGPELGEFDHFVWITMTDQGPLMANLELDGVWGEGLVTEDVKAYINKVSGKNALQMEPLFVDNDDFEDSTIPIKITNDENVPMTVTFQESFNWDLNAGVEKPMLTVAPNSVEMIDLSIRNRRGMTVSEIEPLKLTAELSYAFEDSPELAIPMTYYVKPEPKYNLPRASAKTVDGSLDDWKTLTHTLKTENADDLNVQFDLSYDDDFVYAAVKVMDDELKGQEGASVWTQDMAGIVLNAAPTQKSAMDKGDDWYESSVLVLATPEAADRAAQFYPTDRPMEGLQKAAKTIEGGYVLEVAVPISYIEEQQGKNWETVRFNIRIEDFDGEEHNGLWFQPEWRSDENRVGSGMFFRDLKPVMDANSSER